MRNVKAHILTKKTPEKLQKKTALKYNYQCTVAVPTINHLYMLLPPTSLS